LPDAPLTLPNSEARQLNRQESVSHRQPDSRSRIYNDLMTRGQDRRGESPATAASATTHPEGNATLTKSESKREVPEKFHLVDLENAYKKRSQDIVGTEKEEDFLDAISLLEKLLTLDPTKRITARQALKHRFLAENKP